MRRFLIIPLLLICMVPVPAAASMAERDMTAYAQWEARAAEFDYAELIEPSGHSVVPRIVLRLAIAAAMVAIPIAVGVIRKKGAAYGHPDEPEGEDADEMAAYAAQFMRGGEVQADEEEDT